MRHSIATNSPQTRRVTAIVVAAAVALAGLAGFSATRAAAENVVVAEQVAAATETTMWGNSVPRRVALDQDREAVELGTKFTATSDGEVTGLRFFKSKGMTGAHVGTLWSSTGASLGSVKFTNETASGWQTATLKNPVQLKAGKAYTVSYSVPAGGRYAATTQFVGGSDSSHLTVSQKNSGVYSYAQKKRLPASTWQSSQYWADVVFAAEAGRPVEPTKPPVEPTKPPVEPTKPPVEPTKPPVEPTKPPVEPTKPPVTPTTPPVVTPPGSTAGAFPTRESAGLPDGWTPKQQVTGTMYIRQAGQVVEDLRITNGTIVVEAPNVTLRRIEALGSNVVNGQGPRCVAGLTIEDSEFLANGRTSDSDVPVIQYGSYSVKNIVIDGVPEGLRVGGTDIGCGAVSVTDSFIRVLSPDSCTDWHGDGIQGYGGAHLTVRQSTIIMDVKNNCWGTAPFFYPHSQGNTSVDIDGLLVAGGGYPFRSGMPGPVKNLKVVDGSWVYGPVDVRCSVVTAWSAEVVKLNAAGQTTPVRSIPCTGQGN